MWLDITEAYIGSAQERTTKGQIVYWRTMFQLLALFSCMWSTCSFIFWYFLFFGWIILQITSKPFTPSCCGLISILTFFNITLYIGKKTFIKINSYTSETKSMYTASKKCQRGDISPSPQKKLWECRLSNDGLRCPSLRLQLTFRFWKRTPLVKRCPALCNLNLDLAPL